MARLHDRDKQLLGNAGRALDDVAYVEAVAGLGLLGKSRTFSSDGPAVDFSSAPWQAPSAGPRGSRWSRQKLLGAVGRWHAVQAEAPSPRVVVSHTPAKTGGVDVFSLFRILTRPEARTSSVFLNARLPQADLRWQMPIRVGAWQDDYAAFGLQDVATTGPASGIMRFHELSREHARCEVLVLHGTVRTALQQILAAPFAVRAAFVLVVGPMDAPWRRTESLANALLAETRAAGLSLVSLESPSLLADRFQNWAAELSHNTPLDVSLQTAFREVAVLHLLTEQLIEAAALPTTARMLGARLGALPSSAAFDLPKETLGRIGLSGMAAAARPAGLGGVLVSRARTLPFDRESRGGTALAEISTAEKAARTGTTGSEPNRVLQTDVFAIRDGKAVKDTKPFVVGQPHRVEAFIGPPGGGALQADKQFPDKKLDWQNADQFTLGVIFSEPDQWETPQTGEFILGRYGTSDRCGFDFTPTKVGPFRGRLTIHYRGRVLQTALLETRVEASRKDAVAAAREVAPRLSVETQIHGSLTTLDDRRRFDAHLVLNKTVDGKPTLQAAGRDGAYISSLDKIDKQLEKISARLRDVANDAKRYSTGLTSQPCTEMLVKLATEGRELFGRLVIDYIDVSAAARTLRDSEYLQIVATKPDAVIPLELVYEYKAPAAKAKVCPNAQKALLDGHCPADCVPRDSPATHVCPMGFWGLRKVIERHVHNPALGHEAYVEAVEAIAGRDVIALKGPALLAASKNVPSKARKKLEASVVKGWKTSGGVNSVDKWAQWKKTVNTKKPTLLVALPHSSGVDAEISLEISGDTLESRFIDEDYLRPAKDRPPPLVLLMGCDVAGTGDARTYTSHVAQFRRGGAPVILGTLAVIEGGDAATAAGVIVEQLVTVVKREPARFGEVLRAAKRQAMTKGLLMVLGLVGFGDADWQLKL